MTPRCVFTHLELKLHAAIMSKTCPFQAQDWIYEFFGAV